MIVVREWFRCVARGTHLWKQPVLRTQKHGEKYEVQICRKCGRAKSIRVW